MNRRLGWSICQSVLLDLVRVFVLTATSPAALPVLLPGKRSILGYGVLRAVSQAIYWVLKFL